MINKILKRLKVVDIYNISPLDYEQEDKLKSVVLSVTGLSENDHGFEEFISKLTDKLGLYDGDPEDNAEVLAWETALSCNLIIPFKGWNKNIKKIDFSKIKHECSTYDINENEYFDSDFPVLKSYLNQHGIKIINFKHKTLDAIINHEDLIETLLHIDDSVDDYKLNELENILLKKYNNLVINEQILAKYLEQYYPDIDEDTAKIYLRNSGWLILDEDTSFDENTGHDVTYILWEKLVAMGYSEGDIINSDDVIEAANELDMDFDEVMDFIDELEETYDVSVMSNDMLTGDGPGNYYETDSSANERMDDIYFNSPEDVE